MTITKTTKKVALKEKKEESKEEEKKEEGKAVSVEVATDDQEIKNTKLEKYYQAVGRRKTATARVRLYTKGIGYAVNGQDYKEFFALIGLQRIVEAPLRKMKSLERFRVEAKVNGGGAHSQAEAVRHGIARALVVFNLDFRKRLKRAGYIKRDPRQKERKKFGLKKARKAPRWSKR